MDDDLLALETRRRLYVAIARVPGQSAREIQRGAGTAWGETAYHLDRLAEAGVVHRERGAHQDFYFAAEVPLGDRTLLRIARAPAARRILIELLRAPDLTLPEVAARAELSVSRISIHLRRLGETGLVATGRRESLRTFRVADPARVARVLVTYRNGYGDGWVDRLVEAWGEMFPP
jgi:predicted transcriptional regulator